MISLVRQSQIGKGSRDQTSQASQTRRMSQIRRVLSLIDLMAPLRRFWTPEDLAEMLRDRLGEELCDRTVRRDLDFLLDLGLVEIQFLDLNRTGRARATYRLNLRSSETLQTAAIKHSELNHAI